MSALTFLIKPSRIGIVLGLLCAMAGWGVSLWSPLQGLEEWFHDGAFSFRGKRPTRAKVVLIGLDDRSLDELKKPLIHVSPEIATVVAYARKEGATAIGLDMVIPASLKDLRDLEVGEPGDATKLGAAVKDAGNVVLAEWKLEDRWLQSLPQWRFKELADPDPRGTDSGFVNLTEDDDHFVRRQQLLIKTDGQQRMHFALSLFVKHHNVKNVRWENAEAALYLDEERVPLDREQMLRINYAGPPGTFTVLPLSEALAAARAGRRMPELTGSIVIIGHTARTGQDYHTTPFANNFGRAIHTTSSGLMSGTEIHAHVIATLQDRAYVQAPPWLVSMSLVLVIGGLMGRVFTKLGIGWGLILAALHHFAWKYVCFLALSYFYLRLEFVPMITMGILLSGVVFFQRWWTTRHILSVVKSKDVVDHFEADPGQLDLPGEERIVTVLFADIRDFASYSEKHAAHEVVALLDAYFGVLVPIIEAHGGSVTQYIGDGIMAIFGAPKPRGDHALQAVQAARQMVRQIEVRRSEWVKLDCAGLRIGVGIHTGPVIAGTIGSAGRREYTVIGDTVNAAARIETENKTFGTQILISTETYRALPAARRKSLGCAEEGKSARVKGKDQVLTLHAVTVADEAAGVG